MKKKYIIIALILLFGAGAFFYVNKNAGNVAKISKLVNNKDIKTDSPEMFTQYFKNITSKIGGGGKQYDINYRVTELKKAKNRLLSQKHVKTALPWIQRGPANIGGRTRTLVVDPDDNTHNTWFAGAASGGVWKTTDGGNNWTNLAGEFTNLSVSSIVMTGSNNNILYAGTGESFPGSSNIKGNGIWKSEDKGITWTQLAATSSDEDFAYVNRLAVHPDDQFVIAATEKGILKSDDGGTTWTKVYSSFTGVEDLTMDPNDNNTLYAGENSVGVLKSTDAGDTWSVSSDGIGTGNRFEVCVSEVDNNYIYTSAQVVGETSEESDVYMSDDKGASWKKFNDSQNFLGGQGGYDNAIEAHPYNADEVYVGGVDIWKLKFNGTETTSDPEILRAYTINTSFLSFINSGGAYLGGGMSADDGTNLVADDWVSVEIRFGPGLTQKAHRFTVPANSTSGVPAADYTYQDYIEVPFQVWDVTNNVQLMVSFRDQEGDGVFNLYERTGDAWGELGREYIFVNSIPYNATTPDANIATNGGHLYKNLYMFWPTLAEGETWDSGNLPDSKVVVIYGSTILMAGVKSSVADAYGNYGGGNSFDQWLGFGETSIPGLHPDHHVIKIIPTGDPNFILIDANDGGLGYSNDNGVDINQLPNNYITTQFYGVSKHPTENEYIGGMQDNGTWQSPAGEEASNTSQYYFRIGGDGFEALWHAENPDLLLGSLYNNGIRRSTNGGQNWTSVSGIIYQDGPFITKLSASKENPDLVFGVRAGGIYRSTDFGATWARKTISNNWVIDGKISSSHNIEVSLANGKIVWAGGGMATDYGLQMQVSTNYGLNFTSVDDYNLVAMNSYTSGIATHPNEPNTAYVLFSRAGMPKVLKTTDLGLTWTDISGFGTGNHSTTGFPDVVVHCLLVMPQDNNIIWVGTDIGIVESTDNGATWNISDNGFPSASVYDMQIVGKQVVIATHGRGIWTVDIDEIEYAPYINEFTQTNNSTLQLTSDLKVAYDSVQVYLNDTYNKTVMTPTVGVNNVGITESLVDGQIYTTYILAYKYGIGYKSNTIEQTVTLTNVNEYISDFKIFPNPSTGKLFYQIGNEISKNITSISVYNISGQLMFSGNKNATNMINLEQLNNGTYIFEIVTTSSKYSKMFILRK